MKSKPRGEGKIAGSICIKDIYKDFKEDKGKLVDYKTFRRICETFNELIIDHILLESGDYKMPHFIGTLRIKKKKTYFNLRKSLKVDWFNTKKLGKYVYHTNRHTGGKNCMFYWDKKGPIKNKKAYSFIATRTNKRRLAALLLDIKRNIQYFE